MRKSVESLVALYAIFFLVGCSGQNADDLVGSVLPDEWSGLGPSADCTDYLACLEAAGSDDIDVERAVYGPGASCWETPEAALACDAVCETGIAVQLALTPQEQACWSNGPPSTAELIRALGDWLDIDTATPDQCSPMTADSVELTGRSGTEFEFELITSYGAWYWDVCDLAADGSFSCMGSSGAFEPDRFLVDVQVPSWTFTCEVSASP